MLIFNLYQIFPLVFSFFSFAESNYVFKLQKHHTSLYAKQLELYFYPLGSCLTSSINLTNIFQILFSRSSLKMLKQVAPNSFQLLDILKERKYATENRVGSCFKVTLLPNSQPGWRQLLCSGSYHAYSVTKSCPTLPQPHGL